MFLEGQLHVPLHPKGQSLPGPRTHTAMYHFLLPIRGDGEARRKRTLGHLGHSIVAKI